MDRQLLERLIGAGVLVVALVVVVPAILDGESGSPFGDDAGHVPDVPATTNEPRRTHTIRLDKSMEGPPVALEIAEPVSGPEPREMKPSSGSASKAVIAAPAQPVQPAAAKPLTVSKAIARAKPPSTPAPRSAEPVAVPESGWVVQLGSFSSRQNAQRLADEVGGRGFSVFLMPLDRSGQMLYRVRVGPRDTRPQAVELAGRLAKAGYSGQVAQQ